MLSVSNPKKSISSGGEKKEQDKTFEGERETKTEKKKLTVSNLRSQKEV